MAEAASSRMLQQRAGIPSQLAIPRNVHERPIKSVPQPAANKPTEAEFFTKTDRGELKPNHAFLKDHFFREGRLTEKTGALHFGTCNGGVDTGTELGGCEEPGHNMRGHPRAIL
ncbi:hypothetical protein FPV67DRAFT_1216730 [Lyophyllum atratum]|nr:hypothetical protein FPV67DRAFT_1216730 [Lyophyllum atratum]